MPLPEALRARLSAPVVCAPMFLVSGLELVTACCREGVLGTFPALNARTTEQLDEWLTQLKGAIGDSPFGVNLIVHKSNPRLMADLEVVARHRVPLVITSLGAVSDLVAQVHGWGGLVFHDVTNARHGRKAAEAGVDGLIAVSAGAGGHAGSLSPFALMAELRAFFPGTVLLAGCIGTGADVLAALAMGADLAYMGTRFIATREASAPDAYKQMLLDAGAEDIVYTPAVSGVPANFLRPSLLQAGYDLQRLTAPGAVRPGEALKPLDDEAKVWKTVWSAGQGVAAVHDLPTVAELCLRLRNELTAAYDNLLPSVGKGRK